MSEASKKHRATIYLSGTMGSRTYEEVMKERNEARGLLEEKGFRVLCPTRGREGQWKRDQIISRKGRKFKIEELIARDLMDIRNSDAILILTGDVPTDGTWLEYGYAVFKCEIPVIMVSKKMVDQNVWSSHFTAYIAEDVGEAVDWMDVFLFYENKRETEGTEEIFKRLQEQLKTTEAQLEEALKQLKSEKEEKK